MAAPCETDHCWDVWPQAQTTRHTSCRRPGGNRDSRWTLAPPQTRQGRMVCGSSSFMCRSIAALPMLHKRRGIADLRYRLTLCCHLLRHTLTGTHSVDRDQPQAGLKSAGGRYAFFVFFHSGGHAGLARGRSAAGGRRGPHARAGLPHTRRLPCPCMSQALKPCAIFAKVYGPATETERATVAARPAV